MKISDLIEEYINEIITQNEVAELTIYHRNQVAQLKKESIKSKSFIY